MSMLRTVRAVSTGVLIAGLILMVFWGFSGMNRPESNWVLWILGLAYLACWLITLTGFTTSYLVFVGLTSFLIGYYLDNLFVNQFLPGINHVLAFVMLGVSFFILVLRRTVRPLAPRQLIPEAYYCTISPINVLCEDPREEVAWPMILWGFVALKYLNVDDTGFRFSVDVHNGVVTTVVLSRKDLWVLTRLK